MPEIAANLRPRLFALLPSFASKALYGRPFNRRPNPTQHLVSLRLEDRQDHPPAVDGLDELQSTRASLSPQSGESISGRRGSMREISAINPIFAKTPLLVNPCYIGLQIRYLKRSTPFFALTGIVQFVLSNR